jgi:metacaspase-1
MAKGLSVHIGLNRVDPAHYHNWDGALRACENDARDMRELAEQAGFEGSELLLTEDATAEHVIQAISEASGRLGEDDIFFLTYSGHGGQVPDTNGDEPEDEARDETWVLFDRQLVDDELFDLWSKFHEGTRIFVLSDSCHSGTVARGFYNEELIQQIIERYNDMDLDEPRVRSVPEELRTPIYEDSRDTYDAIQQSVPPGDKAEVDAQVILISGCQDNQESLDGSRNGLFTAKLLETWKQGGFRGYRSFARKIKSKLPPTQSPNYFKTGHVKPEFEREQPLTIADREQTAA